MTPLRKTEANISTGMSTTDNNVISTANMKINTRVNIENELIKAYREENSLLRNMKGDSLLYNKLLGINITQERNMINFTIQRTSSTGKKKLDFVLEETEKCYIFTLKDSENCNIPEYFYDVIEFEKKAFPQFFYKAMQAVYETRTNE